MYLLCADLALSHVQAFPEPAPVAYICDLVFINFTPCVPLVGEQERGKDIDEINQVGVSITLFRGGSGLRNLRQEDRGELQPLSEKQNVVILPPTTFHLSNKANIACKQFHFLPPNENHDRQVSL